MSGTVSGARDIAVREGIVWKGIQSPLKMWIQFKGDTAVDETGAWHRLAH